MRVTIVSESFLPTVNGVTTSVCRVLDHLRAEGHEAQVISPAARSPKYYAGFPISQVPSVAYRQFPVGLPSSQVQHLIADFEPNVVHAASPFLLGAQAMTAARRLKIPSVAIFQTDVAGYARRNNLGPATTLAWRLVRRVHERADLTLVPSTASMADLRGAGVRRLARWGRGVDLDAYHPHNRDGTATAFLRRRLAPRGETVIGYVGRIAPEKQLERLEALRGLPGIRIAIVGGGPAEPQVRRALRGPADRTTSSTTASTASSSKRMTTKQCAPTPSCSSSTPPCVDGWARRGDARFSVDRGLRSAASSWSTTTGSSARARSRVTAHPPEKCLGIELVKCPVHTSQRRRE